MVSTRQPHALHEFSSTHSHSAARKTYQCDSCLPASVCILCVTPAPTDQQSHDHRCLRTMPYGAVHRIGQEGSSLQLFSFWLYYALVFSRVVCDPLSSSWCLYGPVIQGKYNRHDTSVLLPSAFRCRNYFSTSLPTRG